MIITVANGKIPVTREFRLVVDLNLNANCGWFWQTGRTNSRDSLCCQQMEQILEEKNTLPLFLKLITMTIFIRGFAAAISAQHLLCLCPEHSFDWILQILLKCAFNVYYFVTIESEVFILYKCIEKQRGISCGCYNWECNTGEEVLYNMGGGQDLTVTMPYFTIKVIFSNKITILDGATVFLKGWSMGKVEFVVEYNVLQKGCSWCLNWLLVSFRLMCINSFSFPKEVHRH